MKYRRFIDAAGGWEAFQTVLAAAAQVAAKHGVSVSNVATRWVLEQRRVAGVIIGARLGQNFHAEDNLRLFSFALDDADRACFKTPSRRRNPSRETAGTNTASHPSSRHRATCRIISRRSRAPSRPNPCRAASGS
jgi:hypothetical protein